MSAPPCPERAGGAPARRLIVSLAVVGLALLAGCGAPEPPLQVGSNHWPGYMGLYYARELGRIDPQRVRLLDFTSTQQSLQAFRNGALDAVAVTLDEALLLAEQQGDSRAILVFDISQGADVLLARPDLDGLAALKGRRIGVETTALGAYMLARVLDAAKLTADEVEVVHVPLDDHARAYLEGRVDAVITFEPVRAQLLAAGARELFDSRRIPGEIVDVLVVRSDLVKKRRGDLCHLLEGHFEALERLRAAPAEAATRLTGPEGIAPRELVAAWRLMHLPDRAENRRLLGGGEGGLAATLRKLESVMLANQLLNRPIDTPNLLEPALVEGCAR